MLTAFFLLLRKLPLSFYLTIIGIVVISGGYLFWRNQIIAEAESKFESELMIRKNQEIQAEIEKSKENKRSRERTDANVRKMSNSDVDNALQLNGWLRPD